MVAILKAPRRAKALLLTWVAATLVLWGGCGDPGSQALLKGRRFLDQGQPQQALEQFQRAVRLMPNSAQAYNHLGLSYHRLNQSDLARKAYHTALTLDPTLASTRFNLGCLLLDLNQPEAALDELTSFVMVQPGSVEGWLRLGLAQRRSGKFGDAERSFMSALELDPGNPIALNNLGLVRLDQRRPVDALQCFKKAQERTPLFAPAVLNEAVLIHRQKNRVLALQKYKQYLDLKPRPENWAEVAALAQRLELDIQPLPIRPITNEARLLALRGATQPAPEVQPPPIVQAAQATHSPVAPPPLPPSPIASNGISQTPLVVVTNVSNSVSVRPVQTEVPLTNTASNPVQTVVDTAPPPAPAATARPEPPAAKPPAQPVAAQEQPVPARPADPSTPKPAPSPTGISTNRPAPLRATETVSSPRQTPSAPTAITPAKPSPRGQATSIARYAYRRPTPGETGQVEVAQRLIRQGLQLHRTGRRTQAIEKYQEAVQADATCYEAFFNMGVAGYETADWPLSLSSYEMAMALKPESLDARFNFAVALQRANYPLDALFEFRRLSQEYPANPEYHLSIANLYNQVFRDREKARVHYLKVLEVAPRHPEAQKIRYWLNANK